MDLKSGGAVTPNWFATVMGTGIVAVAAAGQPNPSAGVRFAAVLMWALATTLFVALIVTTVSRWRGDPTGPRRHALDPILGHFYGAVPMAALTVGAGTLLVGRDVVGLRLALDIDWTLWILGTVGGLVTAAVVPYLMVTRAPTRAPFGGWLMPVVPPMVSASTGALLVPYAPAGTVRVALLIAGYALFAFSLSASALVIVRIGQQLARHGVGEARLVPTLWIVLGPLGQSITAAGLLGRAAPTAVSAPVAHALQAFGLAYGVPVWGGAVLWALGAGFATLRTAAHGLPFSLTWWSFTFPVGTVATGTNALAARTGAAVFATGADVAFLALAGAWLLVAGRTAHGLLTGGLSLSARAGSGSATSARRLQPTPGS